MENEFWESQIRVVRKWTQNLRFEQFENALKFTFCHVTEVSRRK